MRRGSVMPHAPLPPGPGGSSVQVLTLPQLDAVQRTQKTLDSRLVQLQQVTDQINVPSGMCRQPTKSTISLASAFFCSSTSSITCD